MNPTRPSALVVAALLASGAAAGCRDKTRPDVTKGTTPVSSALVYGLSPGEEVPAGCRTYAEKLIQCMQDPHFPKDARDAQTSALVQMMARMKLTDVPAAERAETTRNATDECDVTLSALRAASGTSCPSAF
jgi:hypothetical protein